MPRKALVFLLLVLWTDSSAADPLTVYDGTGLVFSNESAAWKWPKQSVETQAHTKWRLQNPTSIQDFLHLIQSGIQTDAADFDEQRVVAKAHFEGQDYWVDSHWHVRYGNQSRILSATAWAMFASTLTAAEKQTNRPGVAAVPCTPTCYFSSAWRVPYGVVVRLER